MDWVKKRTPARPPFWNRCPSSIRSEPDSSRSTTRETASRRFRSAPTPLQLLAGRGAPARHLAPHDPRSTARPSRRGRRCSTSTRSRRPRARSGSTRERRCLPPDYRLCMITLSPGRWGRGGPARVRHRDPRVREGRFLAFRWPRARCPGGTPTRLWIGHRFRRGNDDHVGIPAPGPAVEARYARSPRTLRRCSRSRRTGVGLSAFSVHDAERRYDMVITTPEFFRGAHYLILGDRKVKLDLPEDVSFNGFFKDHLLISLRSEWTVGWRRLSAGRAAGHRPRRLPAGWPRLRGAVRAQRVGPWAAWPRTRDFAADGDAGERPRPAVPLAICTATDWAREGDRAARAGLRWLPATTDYAETWFFAYTDYLTPSSLYLVEGDAAPDWSRARRRGSTPTA